MESSFDRALEGSPQREVFSKVRFPREPWEALPACVEPQGVRLMRRVGRRVWQTTARTSPSSNRTGGFPGSGSRRLFSGFVGLMHLTLFHWGSSTAAK
jgi:hypothetical protein